MTLLPIALLLSLGAAPLEPACRGERVTLLPLEAVAVTRADARRTEEVLRRALTKMTGTCLEPRKETVDRLRALGGRLAPCVDPACRVAQVKTLGARWLVRGRVLGLGGARTVALVLVGPEGQESRGTFVLPTNEAAAEQASARALTALWEELEPRQATQARTLLRPWPQVLIGTGAAALVAGVGFGLAARSTERRLSKGTGGCEGEGETFRRCFADGLRKGRQQSRVANGLLGAGAVLSAGGTLLFVWELP